MEVEVIKDILDEECRGTIRYPDCSYYHPVKDKKGGRLYTTTSCWSCNKNRELALKIFNAVREVKV